MSHPDLAWSDAGTPISLLFDDPYFTGGIDETRHVFLAGNDLPARLHPHFQVAELGFGTGLNLLALAQIAEVPVRYTSFEAFPMAADDMARALRPFGLPQAEELVERWREGTGFRLGQVEVQVILGDARETLAQWQGRADAWFLDGFAPARNPELWEPDLLTEVARHTAPGGTVATYTAAGHVRRGLESAGFTVERTPGFGRKKHMTKGRMPG